MQAILALEDGRLFRGKAFGAVVERVGEVVFNTSLTGYQEIFYRPVVCRADCGPHEPSYWELWDEPFRMRSLRGLTSRAWWCGNSRR